MGIGDGTRSPLPGLLLRKMDLGNASMGVLGVTLGNLGVGLYYTFSLKGSIGLLLDVLCFGLYHMLPMG
jgi:hypothetical protein